MQKAMIHDTGPFVINLCVAVAAAAATSPTYLSLLLSHRVKTGSSIGQQTRNPDFSRMDHPTLFFLPTDIAIQWRALCLEEQWSKNHRFVGDFVLRASDGCYSSRPPKKKERKKDDIVVPSGLSFYFLRHVCILLMVQTAISHKSPASIFISVYFSTHFSSFNFVCAYDSALKSGNPCWTCYIFI